MDEVTVAEPDRHRASVAFLAVAILVLMAAVSWRHRRPEPGGMAAGPAPRPAPEIERRQMPSTPSNLRTAATQAREHAHRRVQMQNDAQARYEARALQLHADLTKRYGNERVNPSWALENEKRLLAASDSDQIRRLGVQPKNLAVQCRSTLCVVTGEFQSRGNAQDWLVLFGTGLGSVMPGMSYRLQDLTGGGVGIEIIATSTGR